MQTQARHPCTPCREMLCQPQAQQDHIPLPSHLQPAPRCTYTCNPDHIAPIPHVAAAAIRRTPSTAIPTPEPSHGVSAAAGGPAPTCVLHSRTCNPDSIPPTNAPRCCIRSPDRLPPLPCTLRAAAGPVPAMLPHLQPELGPTYTSLPLSRLHPPALRIPPAHPSPGVRVQLRPAELLAPRTPAGPSGRQRGSGDAQPREEV